METKIINLLNEHNISFEKYNHEPILTFEKAKEVRETLGYEGIESKSLFLKNKSNEYYVFITTEGEKLDHKIVKNTVGHKLSICKGEELTEVTGCVPGCVSPIGYDNSISLIVDSSIFAHNKVIFSPGVPETTLIISGKDLEYLISNIDNTIFTYLK